MYRIEIEEVWSALTPPHRCVLLYIAAQQMSVTVTLTNNNKQNNIYYIIQKYIQKFVKREKKLIGWIEFTT